MKIGIIGYGFVGKATHILESSKNKFLIYDVNSELCCPKNLSLIDLNVFLLLTKAMEVVIQIL